MKYFSFFKNLKNGDLIGKAPDPYVQVILNDKHQKITTKTLKNDKNPVWDEEFRFEVCQNNSQYKVKFIKSRLVLTIFQILI